MSWGVFYPKGQSGILKDRSEAIQLFLSAARQGHEGARRYLEAIGPRNPVARGLYIRGGGWDKIRKIVAG